MPTSTVIAEVAELGDALAGDLRVGILERDDDPGDAGLGQRDHAGSGAAVVRAGFERGVDGGAAGPVPGLAQGLDLGVRTAGRLGGALADDLAVAHHDRADPRVGRGPPAGGLAPGERPVHEFGVGGHLWCCSVSPGHLGWRPRTSRRSGGVAATSARPRTAPDRDDARSVLVLRPLPSGLSPSAPASDRVDHTTGCRGLAGSQVVNASHYNEGHHTWPPPVGTFTQPRGHSLVERECTPGV